jgi:hypothetical protein
MTTKTEPKPKLELWQAIANREASRIAQSDYKKKQLQHFKPKHNRTRGPEKHSRKVKP